jgi:hypothetical protein
LCVCFHPIYQLCVFPLNLPVECVFPPNLPVVCVFTQFTSCVFPPNLPVVCVFQPNLPVVCVFPPYLPVVSASTLSLYTGCVCVCVFPPYIPAVRVPIFCFYQILTAFDKLKIMSEVPHNKWQLKRCCNYSHKMFQSRDSKLWAVTADSINTFYQFKHDAYCVFNVDLKSHDVRHLTIFDRNKLRRTNKWSVYNTWISIKHYIWLW